MLVRSPMPGVVLEVQASEGMHVQPGVTLVLVESMKMEIPVESPEAGQVTATHVAVGDSVEEDDLLVTLEGAAERQAAPGVS